MPKTPDSHKNAVRFLRPAALTVFIVCAAVLIAYAVGFFRSERTGAALREIYYASPMPSASSSSGPRTGRAKDYIPMTPAPGEEKEGPAVPDASQIPRVTALPAAERLPDVPYPALPDLSNVYRFDALRKENPDIVGWLTVEGLLDTAVVQRDNVFYLTHDALGKENENGAVFLEEAIGLRTRPYTVILYGHNMKSGAVFGGLGNYESLSFLRAHPLIRFTSLYEEGTYAVASVAPLSLEQGAWNWVDLSRLNSATVSWREKEIQKALSLSIYTRTVDVEASDQVLLLITCSGDRGSRRMVMARRLRDGETEEHAAESVGRMRVKE